MARLGVAFHLRDAFMSDRVPHDPARGLVERHEAPLVRLRLLDRFDVAVEADLELGRPGLHRRGDVHPVALDDGRSMSEPRDRRLPTDVLAGRDIPVRRQRGGSVETARRRPAILGPIRARRGGCDGDGEEEQRKSGSHGGGSVFQNGRGFNPVTGVRLAPSRSKIRRKQPIIACQDPKPGAGRERGWRDP